MFSLIEVGGLPRFIRVNIINYRQNLLKNATLVLQQIESISLKPIFFFF